LFQPAVKFTGIYILGMVPGIIAVSTLNGGWTDIDFFYRLYITYRPVSTVHSCYWTAFLGL